ncbi:hypothetical protein [Microlunatus soli]|uniref:hypothetical protein n=1 Tax=Microlunatus soli TaxID=630515 RepID=UPI000B81D78C|nr:hypothetical protein [Microlunatus soli]
MIAATLVAVVVLLGVVVVVRSADGRDDAASAAAGRPPTATSTPDPTASAVADPSTDNGPATPARQRIDSGASVCGLPDAVRDPAEFAAPKADWKYDGVAAYPSGPDYGPGRTSPAGFRYCFQHSPRGALFSAAGSMAFNNTGREASRAWSRYMQAEGRYRDRQLDGEYVPADPSVRSETIGYRMLSYDGDHAKIDLAVRVSTPQRSMTTSVMFDLVWQRGDWRFSSDVPESVQATRLVDLSGYTSWGDA